ncbi:hypothetical protein DSO57_1021440 [Entomophthora muscae]|uniref:Uncharacterized protein n=1 Tax=Entomophthora muscae TaxID=34485 RepID=A0ACC2SSN8_9FUNG|nr:hypothetical protein DSO57_1021440 [Entomophthora muscae]
MATPQQETFLPIPEGDIPDGYVIYQDQLVGNCGKFNSLVINSLVIDPLKLDSLVVDTIVK